MQITVWVQPGARRDAVAGWRDHPDHGRCLVARVAAPARDGRANDALIALLADALAIDRRDIRLTGGRHSRIKRVELPDATPLPIP